MNNNPFSYKGRIGRLSFFITTAALLLVGLFFAIVSVSLKNEYTFLMVHGRDTGNLSLIIVLTSLPCWISLLLTYFSCLKRCRDANTSTKFAWIIFIPLICYIYYFYLLFKKTAYTKDSKQCNISNIVESEKCAINNYDEFTQAMNLYEGKDTEKDYKKAYDMFAKLAEENNAKAKLLITIMSTFGHGSSVKRYKICEVDDVVNSVKDHQFLYDMSQKLFNRIFFEDDFKRAYEADSQMEKEGFPDYMQTNVSNLEIMISGFVKRLSTASANLGSLPAQKFITNRIVWIHL